MSDSLWGVAILLGYAFFFGVVPLLMYYFSDYRKGRK